MCRYLLSAFSPLSFFVLEGVSQSGFALFKPYLDGKIQNSKECGDICILFLRRNVEFEHRLTAVGQIGVQLQ